MTNKITTRTIAIILTVLCVCLFSSCVAVGPVSVAWRSNSTQQFTKEKGKAENSGGAGTVNADKENDANLNFREKKNSGN